MQKLLACIGFIFCALTLYLTSSNAGMKWITQDRYSRIGAFGADKYLYGDLYGLTYLSKFKNVKDTNFVSLPAKDQKVNSDTANLFILGDSYLYSFFKEDPRYYANISQVKFIRWDVANPIEIIPARNQKNILLIESVERNMSGLFNLNSVKARLDRAEAVQSEPNARQKIAHFFAEIDEGIKENLYHKSLEANIEFAWFNFGFWESLKELKADFNLNFFGRVDKEVAISKDQNFLYLAETLNPNNPGSSFSDISEEKLKAQVEPLEMLASETTKDAVTEAAWNENLWGGIPFGALNVAAAIGMLAFPGARINAATCQGWKRFVTPSGQVFVRPQKAVRTLLSVVK